MTTALAPSAVPAPRRPWNRRRQTATRSTALVAASLAVSWWLTSSTELGGVLGFYLGLAVCLPALTFAEAIRHGRNVAIDRVATSAVVAAFGAVLIPWVSIVATVYQKGSKAFHGGYLTEDMRITPSSDPLQFGGVAHAILGTLLMVLIASAIAVPLGIMAAVYIVEVKGRFAGLVRFLTQAMSGVPSIVAGLFIYSTVVIFFGGFSAWAGALAYVILMLPTVARTAEEVLKLVPDDLRAASYALGASQACSRPRSSESPAWRGRPHRSSSRPRTSWRAAPTSTSRSRACRSTSSPASGWVTTMRPRAHGAVPSSC
jgi:phosphate transport system permease protein